MVQIKRQKNNLLPRRSLVITILAGLLVLGLWAGFSMTNSNTKDPQDQTSTTMRRRRGVHPTKLDLPPEAMVELPTKHQLIGYKGEIVELRSALMPAIGFGTCCRKTAKGEAIYQSTLAYLEQGGRLIDTAMAYGNHEEIGKAIKDSKIPRNQVWVTSKISPNKLPKTHDLDKIKSSTINAVNEILEELGFEGDDAYLDLCLIHTQKLGQDPTIAIWNGLIESQTKGLVRTIGVSNFNRLEILDLYRATEVLPEVNQIQYHPWTTPEWKELVEWQQQHKIATTAYNSLGGSRFEHTDAWTALIEHLAKKYQVTQAQLFLRWALQQPGVAVIPGSSSVEHIQENLNVPRFTISEDDLQMLEASPAPRGWWDAQRGPAKYLGEEAHKAWQGDHTVGMH